MDIPRFKKLPLMGILRGVDTEVIEPLAEAIVASGIETVEITMNTSGVLQLIKKMAKISKQRLFVGAGTVLDLEMLKGALDSGATFAVTPVLVEEVVGYCVKHNIAVFPGAFSPQEIYKAWSSGATMVKVFPAKVLGPAYFKEIKGPFSQIELLACAGVTAENLKDYFSSGAAAIAFGASIFKKEWLVKKDFIKITESIRAILASYAAFAAKSHCPKSGECNNGARPRN
ncbi:MAG: bifunctional 4-hydroxy-2-oxoglutarate aldolase/2-dehydro-3-deoxy-phosphogluconate aldolase [Candidatus Omnitrophota bacterium]|nr:bifunctional 4-hydroxy-2-oxoglutarate aldolase/2-dehydro-3-deoxy-phosphogluconate aldolase [Candidatus Omnitrophota bacterium]